MEPHKNANISATVHRALLHIEREATIHKGSSKAFQPEIPSLPNRRNAFDLITIIRRDKVLLPRQFYNARELTIFRAIRRYPTFHTDPHSTPRSKLPPMSKICVLRDFPTYNSPNYFYLLIRARRPFLQKQFTNRTHKGIL